MCAEMEIKMEIQLWKEILEPYGQAVDELVVKFNHALLLTFFISKNNFFIMLKDVIFHKIMLVFTRKNFYCKNKTAEP